MEKKFGRFTLKQLKKLKKGDFKPEEWKILVALKRLRRKIEKDKAELKKRGKGSIAARTYKKRIEESREEMKKIFKGKRPSALHWREKSVPYSMERNLTKRRRINFLRGRSRT